MLCVLCLHKLYRIGVVASTADKVTCIVDVWMESWIGRQFALLHTLHFQFHSFIYLFIAGVSIANERRWEQQ